MTTVEEEEEPRCPKCERPLLLFPNGDKVCTSVSCRWTSKEKK